MTMHLKKTHPFTPASPPRYPQARDMQTGGAKWITKIVKQTCKQYNKSAFICVHLRLFLVDNLQPHFTMEPVPASDSAGFLTQLNDVLIEINNSRRCEY